MAQIKNSFAPLGKSVGYSIDAEGFTWTGEVDLTAADLLQGEASPEEQGANDDAMEWLREALADGPQEAGPLQQRFERETGHNRRTLQRAFKSLGGKKEREGFGPGGKLVWSLPTIDDTPTPLTTGTRNLVVYGETTATKGLQGQRSTIDDTKRESVAYGGPAVAYNILSDPDGDPEVKKLLKEHPEFSAEV
jgi:hypothetical protein